MQADLWTALEQDLLVRQDLRATTTAKTIGRLRALEAGGIDLQDPQLDQWNLYMARRKRAGAKGTATLHDYAAMRRLLSWHGLEWRELRRPRMEIADIRVPPDDVVHRLMHLGDDEDDDELELARFAFRLGFYTGIRPEAEHLALRLESWSPETRELKVWSDKVRRERVLVLEPWLAAVVDRYIEETRPRFANKRQNSSRLMLRPSGRPWTCDAYRMFLSRTAKRVYPWFRPYHMRHWGLTYRLVQTGFDVLAVQTWAGHRRISTTERYLHVAKDRLRQRMVEHQVQPLILAGAP